MVETLRAGMALDGSSTYRHHLAALAHHALLGTNIDHGAVEAAPSLLNQPRHNKDSRFIGNLLQLLSCAVAAKIRIPQPGQLSLNPPVSSSSPPANNIPQVDGTVKILCKLFPPLDCPLANDAPKRRSMGVATDESFWKQEDVD